MEEISNSNSNSNKNQLIMNFQTTENFEEQLSTLVAFIVLFEKKIEELREKLAGNQEFHTRLIFQRMDINKKGEIRAEDILYTIGIEEKSINIHNCQSFCRKHSISGALSYDELLTIITPKNHKILAQRLLVRTAKRGATLPGYLWKYFCEMFSNLIKMTKVTEQIRQKIQNLTTNLSHLDMVQFFKRCLLSPERLWHFCNINSSSGQYGFEAQDAIYLSNHIKSKNSLAEMTDQDIKQVICPLDMNFQKTVKEMGHYYQAIKNQKSKTVNGGFYQPKLKENTSDGYVNFLKATYVKSFRPQTLQNFQPSYFDSIQPQISNRKMDIRKDESVPAINIRQPAGRMYIDNFIRPSYGNSISESRTIELDRYLQNHSPNKNIPQYEKFDDDLRQNRDESDSAFSQY